MPSLHVFLCGALSVSCVFVGLFFIKYYRTSHDRLFTFFAITFWVLAVNWASIAFLGDEQDNVYFYLPRLIAFVVLLAGIIDKNRRSSS